MHLIASDEIGGNSIFHKIKMGGLNPGKVPEKQFWLLVDISPIHSEKVVLALRDYFVLGLSRKEICNRYQMNNGYFSTSISRLNRISQSVQELVQFYSKDN